MKHTAIELKITMSPDSVALLASQLADALEQRGLTASPTQQKVVDMVRRSHLVQGELPDDMGLLLDNRQACELLSISERKLWQMWHSGRMPQPVRLGRVVRWGYEELRAWVNAGCPAAHAWQWPKP